MANNFSFSMAFFARVSSITTNRTLYIPRSQTRRASFCIAQRLTHVDRWDFDVIAIFSPHPNRTGGFHRIRLSDDLKFITWHLLWGKCRSCCVQQVYNNLLITDSTWNHDLSLTVYRPSLLCDWHIHRYYDGSVIQQTPLYSLQCSRLPCLDNPKYHEIYPLCV